MIVKAYTVPRQDWRTPRRFSYKRVNKMRFLHVLWLTIVWDNR